MNRKFTLKLPGDITRWVTSFTSCALVTFWEWFGAGFWWSTVVPPCGKRAFCFWLWCHSQKMSHLDHPEFLNDVILTAAFGRYRQMSHQEYFFLEYMNAVFTSLKSDVKRWLTIWERQKPNMTQLWTKQILCMLSNRKFLKLSVSLQKDKSESYEPYTL